MPVHTLTLPQMYATRCTHRLQTSFCKKVSLFQKSQRLQQLVYRNSKISKSLLTKKPPLLQIRAPLRASKVAHKLMTRATSKKTLRLKTVVALISPISLPPSHSRTKAPWLFWPRHSLSIEETAVRGKNWTARDQKLLELKLMHLVRD